MKKILVILNGELVPHHLLYTAIKFAAATASYLHVIFTNYALDLDEYNYPFPNDLSLTRNKLTGKTIAEENAALLESSIRLVTDQCQAEKVNFYIDPDKDIYAGKLIEYSAFSDFILADATGNLNQGHIADLLQHAHCPVYLVSKAAKDAEQIVFAYDGSPSCMHAIKTFTYLFPEYKSLPTHLVHISPETGTLLPQKTNIMSWLQAHYSGIQIKTIKGDLREALVSYIKSVNHPLVVMGSFDRSAVSNFFHKSLANAVIEEGSASLFIAHK